MLEDSNIKDLVYNDYLASFEEYINFAKGAIEKQSFKMYSEACKKFNELWGAQYNYKLDDVQLRNLELVSRSELKTQMNYIQIFLKMNTDPLSKDNLFFIFDKYGWPERYMCTSTPNLSDKDMKEINELEKLWKL